MEDRFVGGIIFGKIQADTRIHPDLAYCLFCEVVDNITSKASESPVSIITYKIPLNCIKGNSIKQCPACKRIYILSDPTQ